MTDLEVFKRFLDLCGGGYVELNGDSHTYLIWGEGREVKETIVGVNAYEQVEMYAAFDIATGSAWIGCIESNSTGYSGDRQTITAMILEEFPEYAFTYRGVDELDIYRVFEGRKQDKTMEDV